MSAAETNVNHDRLLQILVGPHVSEKSVMIGEQARKQITFRVLTDATKNEIRSAVELAWDQVKVESVQTVNVKGKTKRFGRREGRRKDWKKAYVTLAEGQDIDFEKSI